MEAIYDGRSIPVKFYGMPRIGTWMKLVVNGEECKARATKWGKHQNTYWLYKNVAMYVNEKLPDGAELALEGVPDGFGNPDEPEPRKSYYLENKSKGVTPPPETEPAGA